MTIIQPRRAFNRDLVVVWVEDEPEEVMTGMSGGASSFEEKILRSLIGHMFADRSMEHVVESFREAGVGISILFASNPDQMVTLLEAVRNGKDGRRDGLGVPSGVTEVSAIVVDDMLCGVCKVSTPRGEFDVEHGYKAGWVIVQELLRTPDSPYRDIPTLIYGSGSFGDRDAAKLEQINASSGPTVHYVEKYLPDSVRKVAAWLARNIFGISCEFPTLEPHDVSGSRSQRPSASRRAMQRIANKREP